MMELVLVENTVIYGKQKFLMETKITCVPYTLIAWQLQSGMYEICQLHSYLMHV